MGNRGTAKKGEHYTGGQGIPSDAGLSECRNQSRDIGKFYSIELTLEAGMLCIPQLSLPRDTSEVNFQEKLFFCFLRNNR
jgi:hypothetical protein